MQAAGKPVNTGPTAQLEREKSCNLKNLRGGDIDPSRSIASSTARTSVQKSGIKIGAPAESFLGERWRPREDSNLRPQDSYHFGFNRRPRAFVVWTVPSPWAEAFRCCPSSLYTFNGFLRSLARDWHAESSAKRSPNLSKSTTHFRCAAPNLQPGILCSILLSYVDISRVG